MKRKIIEINEELCNGCTLCVTACHEGAIEMVNGKARLVSDEYCDGLGDCLPECPTGAIKMIEREAKEFDEEAVRLKMIEREKLKVTPKPKSPCGCPGSMSKRIERVEQSQKEETKSIDKPISELSQWPVQLNLININAPYLDGAHILVAADCTAYAYADIHKDFIKGRITLIGCPKLDDNKHYIEKLTEMFRQNDIKSVTVLRMQVPCCGGIVMATREALLQAKKILPYKEVIISTSGEIISE